MRSKDRDVAWVMKTNLAKARMAGLRGALSMPAPGGRGALLVGAFASPRLHLSDQVRHALAPDPLQRERDALAHAPARIRCELAQPRHHRRRLHQRHLA